MGLEVVPSGIEPLSEAPETSILSVELRDQNGPQRYVDFLFFEQNECFIC